MLKKYIALALASLVLQQAKTQVSPQNYSGPVNYIRVWDAKAPEQNHNVLITRPLRDVLQTTNYVDGLGRPIQTVVKQGSLATGNNPTDLVSFINYDAYGRETFKYLPYASAASDGNFKPTVSTEHQSFNNSRYGPQGETYFYGQTNYEASPLNRVTKTMAPGNSWVGSSSWTGGSIGVGVKMDYLLNDWNDEVKIWTVHGSGHYEANFIYSPGQLYKNVTTDEHGKQVVEYKDKEGKVILKKVQIDNSPGASYAGWLCTYYLYDDYNQLRLVIQPEGVKAFPSPSSNWIINVNTNTNTTLLNEQCFRYEYDGRGRMTEKKVPGAGVVEMVYDSRDRLVLTRDANLANQSPAKWMYTRYDDLNRPSETGIITASDARTTMQWYADNYANPDFPYWWWTNELLTKTFYDNYNWNPSSGTGLNNSFNSSYAGGHLLAQDDYNFPYPRAVTQSTETHGMVTGTKTRVLGSGNFITTVHFYDKDGRVIQTQSTNITGGIDATTTQYSFAGQPLRVIQRTNKTGSQATDLITASYFDYDDLWRLTTTTKYVNGIINNASVNRNTRININKYNAIGQLTNKSVGKEVNTTKAMQSLTYEYNIRGWLLGINRAFVKNTNTGLINHFGFELAYDKTDNIIVGQAYANTQLNGNITGTTWKSIGDEEVRKYDYTYDAANRLLKAEFNQLTAGTFNQSAGLNFNTQMGNGSNHNTAYDANGNILAMQQWGVKGVTSALIDNLSYNYISQSNKLLGVADGSPANNLGDFTDKNNSNNDYSYDANGNLTKDDNKDITNISYNHLNLPQSITLTGTRSIQYVYDAAGSKLSKTVSEPGQNPKTTLYIAGAVYEGTTNSDANFQLMGHEEGRFRHTPTAPSGTVSFDYMLKDHLGNVRMVLTDETKINNYVSLTGEGNAGTAQVDNQNAIWDDKSGNSIDVVNRRTTRPGNFGDNSSNGSYAFSITKAGGAIGAGKLLKVMSGDNIDANIEYLYNTNVADNSNAHGLSSIISNLVIALGAGNSAAGSALKADAGTAITTLNTNSDFQNLFNPQNTGSYSVQPKAYLHILLFDEQFKFDKNNSCVVPVAAWVGGSKQQLNLSAAVKKNGFAYIYFSNESNEMVYFDNFNLTHVASPLIEETHYYPFGLSMSGISSKAANSLENKRKFNDGTELNSTFDIHLYETNFRSLDPQLGRFWQVDPYADITVENSPYVFASNNPILFNDPLGLQDSTNAPGFANSRTGANDLGNVSVTSSKKQILAPFMPYINFPNSRPAHIASFNDWPLSFSRNRSNDLLDSWAMGLGAENRIYLPNHPMTRRLKNARQVNRARAFFYKKYLTNYKNGLTLKGGSVTNFNGSFGLPGLVMAGLDIVEQFVGSMGINIYVDESGGNLLFVINNTTSMTSAAYHIANSFDRVSGQMSPGGNLNQVYIWKEPISAANFNNAESQLKMEHLNNAYRKY